jgi:hypothetical protein
VTPNWEPTPGYAARLLFDRSLTPTPIMPKTEPTQVELVGQVIDNSHGGSPFTGDWLAVIAMVCWPVTIPAILFWLFVWMPIADFFRRHKTIVAPEVPTAEDAVNSHAQRAVRYEAEGNTAMAEHTRRMYHLPPKITADPPDSFRR